MTENSTRQDMLIVPTTGELREGLRNQIETLRAENARLRNVLGRLVEYEKDVRTPTDPDEKPLRLNASDAEWMASLAKAALRNSA